VDSKNIIFRLEFFRELKVFYDNVYATKVVRENDRDYHEHRDRE